MKTTEYTIQPRIYAGSISVSEHREFRDAIQRALVSGETTWILNSVDAVVAAIVPASDATRDAYRRSQEGDPE